MCLLGTVSLGGQLGAYRSDKGTNGTKHMQARLKDACAEPVSQRCCRHKKQTLVLPSYIRYTYYIYIYNIQLDILFYIVYTVTNSIIEKGI